MPGLAGVRYPAPHPCCRSINRVKRTTRRRCTTPPRGSRKWPTGSGGCSLKGGSEPPWRCAVSKRDVSAKCREPLCQTPFLQVTPDRRVEVMCSHRVQLCALILCLSGPTVAQAILCCASSDQVESLTARDRRGLHAKWRAVRIFIEQPAPSDGKPAIGESTHGEDQSHGLVVSKVAVSVGRPSDPTNRSSCTAERSTGSCPPQVPLAPPSTASPRGR
jgi:hypothetical protein